MPGATTGSATGDDAAREAVVRATVFRVLGGIAPEVDLATIRPDASLRDQVDLDSMDFLNFVLGLAETLHVEVPESDYPQLGTLDGCVAYLASRAPHDG